ncbi:MAG TPA: hypothetical protein VL947_02155, partial [Cytophagales bacterium]|nr:hypothetical protein [Cytophagales bacterium]
VNDIVQFSCFLILGAVYLQSTHKTYDGGDKDDKQESPIPPAIKNIAGHHQKYVLKSKIFIESKPINQKDYGQEDRKIKGIE